jgi:hypothetical protein
MGSMIINIILGLATIIPNHTGKSYSLLDHRDVRCILYDQTLYTGYST